MQLFMHWTGQWQSYLSFLEELFIMLMVFSHSGQLAFLCYVESSNLITLVLLSCWQLDCIYANAANVEEAFMTLENLWLFILGQWTSLTGFSRGKISHINQRSIRRSGTSWMWKINECVFHLISWICWQATATNPPSNVCHVHYMQYSCTHHISDVVQVVRISSRSNWNYYPFYQALI